MMKNLNVGGGAQPSFFAYEQRLCSSLVYAVYAGAPPRIVSLGDRPPTATTGGGGVWQVLNILGILN